MAKHIIYNVSQQQVGKFDTITLEYSTARSLEIGQIFIHPKYRKDSLGSVGISYEIIQKLIRLKCETIKFTITGYKRTFDASIEMNKFLEKAVPFHAKGQKLGDKQLIIYLASCQLIDYNQKELEIL